MASQEGAQVSATGESRLTLGIKCTAGNLPSPGQLWPEPNPWAVSSMAFGTTTQWGPAPEGQGGVGGPPEVLEAGARMRRPPPRRSLGARSPALDGFGLSPFTADTVTVRVTGFMSSVDPSSHLPSPTGIPACPKLCSWCQQQGGPVGCLPASWPWKSTQAMDVSVSGPAPGVTQARLRHRLGLDLGKPVVALRICDEEM